MSSTATTTRSEPARSAGHACFAAWDRGEDAWAACLPGEAEVEFFVDDSGAVLWRAPVGAPLGAGGRRTDATVCSSGADTVRQLCRKLGCKTPAATDRRLLEREEESVAQPAATEVAAKGDRVMKGKNSGKSIVEAWETLFVENEHRVRDGKKPWTDAELVEKMGEDFPKCKGKSTVNRPRMYRSCYNDGSFMYEKRGAPGSRKLPKSSEYGADGKVVEPGTRRATAAKRAAAGAKAPKAKAAKGKAKKAGVRRAGK